MRKAWIYLVVIATLGAAGIFIAHLRLSDIPDLAIGHSAPEPVLGRPREKVISYEVLGRAGTAASVSYLDESGGVRKISATLPWQLTVRARVLTVPTGVVAQTEGDQLTCRIAINSEVRAQQTSNDPAATVNCNVLVS